MNELRLMLSKNLTSTKRKAFLGTYTLANKLTAVFDNNKDHLQKHLLML